MAAVIKRNGRRKAGARGAGAGALAQADYERLAEFRYVLRRFVIFSEEAAEQAGLTPQQHQALLAIKGHPGPPMTAGVLAERLAIRHHSAVGLINRLAAKGLVRRARASADRRQVLLELTGRAERLLGDLTRAHRAEIERLAPLLRRLLRHFEMDRQRSP
jgi:DNA-binding MarR family transcriptional regulator